MLTRIIESILLFFVNRVADGAARVRQDRSRPGTSGARGLLARLLGRRPAPPAGAPPSGPPADPPVVIGELIPSPREALRQGGAGKATISLTTEMRSKHTYCVGKSGMGKTNFNVQLIDADIAAGRAVVLLDYRGDLVTRVCRRLATRYSPDEVAERLLLIDLRTPTGRAGSAEERHTVGFNPLTQCGPNPYTSAFFVYDVFEQHLGAALGVQVSETLRNCLLALAMAGGTLLDIDLMLNSDAARGEILSRVEDAGVLRFFDRFGALNEAQRLLWTNPIQNKISPWTATPVLRNTFGDTHSVSVRDFLDCRPDAIFLCCAGADEHFGSTAAMVANLLVNAVAAAVMRTDRPSRHGVHLYVDEFQNLSSGKFAEIISEGRRFGLWSTISHQSPSQLDPKIRTLVRNVVGTCLFFGVGGADAELLAGEIASDEPKAVLRNMLINQQPGDAVLVRQGMAAVRIRTRHAPDPDVPAAAVQALRQASLRHHGRPAAEVEAELRAREEAYLPGATRRVGPTQQEGAQEKTPKTTMTPKQPTMETTTKEIPLKTKEPSKTTRPATRKGAAGSPAPGKTRRDQTPHPDQAHNQEQDRYEVRDHDE